MEDMEQCADILDQATNVTIARTESAVAHCSFLAAPEQEPVRDEEGNIVSWPITECVDCDDDLGARMNLGKIRCIRCQTLLEKRKAGYGTT